MSAADEAPAEDRATYIFNQQDTLLDRCRLSASYHGKRERFLGGTERVMQAVAALAATSAFADIASTATGGGLGQCLALVAAVASILPLVFGFSEKARVHGQLKAQFKTTLASMYAIGLEWTEEQLAEFRAQVAKIEAGEPPALAALVIHCQNEIAVGARQETYPLEWWETLLMHFWSFDGAKIVKRGARESSGSLAKSAGQPPPATP